MKKQAFAAFSLCLLLAACGEEEKKAQSTPAPVAEKTVSKPEPVKEVAKEVTTMVTKTAEETVKAAEQVASEAKKEVTAVVDTMLTADITRGEKVFKRCKACHSKKEGAKHKVGPNLFGVIGRVAGQAEGFKEYSKSMKAYGQPWTVAMIEEYLENPTTYLKEKL